MRRERIRGWGKVVMEADASGEQLEETVRQLRSVILAGEAYRQTVAASTGLGVTETQALSYLAIFGDRGQSDLASDLGITTSASTALVDRLEREHIAERYPHPRDRRRLLVRLTPRGSAIIAQSRLWLAASLTRIPPDELETLSKNLERIATDLRAQSTRVRAGTLPLDLPDPT